MVYVEFSFSFDHESPVRLWINNESNLLVFYRVFIKFTIKTAVPRTAKTAAAISVFCKTKAMGNPIPIAHTHDLPVANIF